MTAWFQPPRVRPLPGAAPMVVAAEPTPLLERILLAHGDDDRPTVQLPVVAGPAALLDLHDALTELGARVDWVQRASDGPCEWCAVDGQAATVTVYGDPDPALPYEHPLTCEAVCTGCARRAVRQAVTEHNPGSRRPIVAEIAMRAGDAR